MSNTEQHIYIEGARFYFDSEVYVDDGPNKMLDYEDGDMVKWVWEGKKMTGVLREENSNLGLFVIENVLEC